MNDGNVRLRAMPVDEEARFSPDPRFVDMAAENFNDTLRQRAIFWNGDRAGIVEESSGMGQSTGYDGRKSRTNTRSAATERPRRHSPEPLRRLGHLIDWRTGVDSLLHRAPFRMTCKSGWLTIIKYMMTREDLAHRSSSASLTIADKSSM